MSQERCPAAVCHRLRQCQDGRLRCHYADPSQSRAQRVTLARYRRGEWTQGHGVRAWLYVPNVPVTARNGVDKWPAVDNSDLWAEAGRGWVSRARRKAGER